MDEISFHAMTDLEHEEEVAAMMRRLYDEDEAAHTVDVSRFPSSIRHLIAHPAAGQIILFCEGSQLRGYALLVPYWSNEFGGTLLFVDELFVVAEARNRGIGHSFFRYLEQQRPFGPVRLALEVSPGNSRGRRFYESLGFVPRRHSTFTRPLFDERA